VTWRQIGRFFEPGQYLRAAQPDEHALFVLHERCTVLRCVDSQTGVRRDLSLRQIPDPQATARRLYESGQWQRVHVIEKAHLARVAQLAQQMSTRAQTLDQYYHHLYHLLWDNGSGYVSIPAHPGHWHGWTYAQICTCIQQLPDSPASLALGVFEKDCWIIGLVLVCARGQIRKITTFEALDAQCLAGGLTEATLTSLAQQLAAVLAPAAGLLLCTPEVFAAWIQQEEKLEVLLNARRQHQAYWHWWAAG
jgi:hypothetical protein